MRKLAALGLGASFLLAACSAWLPPPTGARLGLTALPLGRTEVRVRMEVERRLQLAPLRGWFSVRGELLQGEAVLAEALGQAQGSYIRFEFATQVPDGTYRLRLRFAWPEGAEPQSPSAFTTQAFGLRAGQAIAELSAPLAQGAEAHRPQLGEAFLAQALPQNTPIAPTKGLSAAFSAREAGAWWTLSEGHLFSGHNAFRVPQFNFQEGLQKALDEVRLVRPNIQGQWVSTRVAGGLRGFADGPGPQARFNTLWDGLEDNLGRLLVVDAGNHAIRMLSPMGTSGYEVRTLVGNGTRGFADGVGQSARLSRPVAIEPGASGAYFVADADNRRVRVLTEEADGQWRLSTLTGQGSAAWQDGVGSGVAHQDILDLAWLGDRLWVSEQEAVQNPRRGALRFITPDGRCQTEREESKFASSSSLPYHQMLAKPDGLGLLGMNRLSVSELSWPQGQLAVKALVGGGSGRQLVAPWPQLSLNLSTEGGAIGWDGAGRLLLMERNWGMLAYHFTDGSLKQVAGPGAEVLTDQPTGLMGFGLSLPLPKGNANLGDNCLVAFDDGCLLLSNDTGGTRWLVGPAGVTSLQDAPAVYSHRAGKWGAQGYWLSGNSGYAIVEDHHHPEFIKRLDRPQGTNQPCDPVGPLSALPTEGFGLYAQSHDPQSGRAVAISSNALWAFDLLATGTPSYEILAGAQRLVLNRATSLFDLPVGDADGVATASGAQSNDVDVSPEGVVWMVSKGYGGRLSRTAWEEGLGWVTRSVIRGSESNGRFEYEGFPFQPEEVVAFSNDRAVILSKEPNNLYLATRGGDGRFHLKRVLPEGPAVSSEAFGTRSGADIALGIAGNGQGRLWLVTSPERGHVLELKGWDAPAP